jgi:RNA polymerase sigma-70 factor (ECF subfamily)
MSETSASLLDRLRFAPHDAVWAEMVELYTPLVQSWLRRFGLPENDVDDLVQGVMMIVTRRIPQFERKRTGSFRAWLRTITHHCLRNHRRKQSREAQGTGDSRVVELLNGLADPDSALSREWDREHDRYLVRRLLERVRDRFEPGTWRAFEAYVCQGKRPAEVAEALGMSVGAVMVAKSRVLNRLRKEAADMVEDLGLEAE